MRFPWQKRKVEQPTDFPLKLNTDNLNWCRDARLLLIEGNGTLKWESRGRNEDWSQQYALTLRGTPLIVHNAPECPTCAGLLATGYGLDKADAPELQQISDVINAPYVDLDTSIASMAPLLGLLSSGLYVIADGDSFPADGNGNFFWDVPDAFSNVEATGPAWYNDPDFEFTYSEGAPVFLYPSQPRTRLNQERVDYYTQRFDTTDTFPRAIAFYCAEGISVLLDGHHKAWCRRATWAATSLYHDFSVWRLLLCTGKVQLYACPGPRVFWSLYRFHISVTRQDTPCKALAANYRHAPSPLLGKPNPRLKTPPGIH